VLLAAVIHCCAAGPGCSGHCWLNIRAADAASAPPCVNVNNRLVAEDTVLNDGDLIILTREKLEI
jgi:hypothetical protein